MEWRSAPSREVSSDLLSRPRPAVGFLPAFWRWRQGWKAFQSGRCCRALFSFIDRDHDRRVTHGFAHRFKPLTIVTYDVDVADIVDLRTDDGRRAADVELADMACAWRLDLADGQVPGSWRIANRLRKTAAGILVPSFAHGARQDTHNLVLWKWSQELPHRVTVYDPSGRLPKDQRSWESKAP